MTQGQRWQQAWANRTARRWLPGVRLTMSNRCVCKAPPPLQHLAPEFASLLLPGASEETLRQVEAFLPITLPEEVKVLYRIHDGQADRTYLDECTGLVNGWFFFPLKRMCHAWLININDLGLPENPWNPPFPCPTGERYPAYWHPHWLPFMGHWMGPNYCIDLAPGPNGKMGQILFYNDRYTEYPDPLSPGRSSIRVVAPSIKAFFTVLANDLEAGIYTFDDATGILWSRQMWSALTATEAHVFGYDEETGFWKDNSLGARKRERQKVRRNAFPVREEPDWEDLYREHPQWNPSPPRSADDPFCDL